MSIFVDIEKKLGSFCLKVKFEAKNETLALLGASGCGKSMTLKCIAGIEKPDKGRILVDGITLFDSEKNINLSPQERHIGLLFQNYCFKEFSYDPFNLLNDTLYIVILLTSSLHYEVFKVR